MVGTAQRAQAASVRHSKWLWPLQIAVGSICIMLALAIAFSPQLGGYAFLVLAGAGLMILGLERIAAGIRSRDVKRSSRIINIGIGAGIIIWMGSGFVYPEIATKYFVLFLGLGLLGNGAVRLYEAVRKSHESWNITLLAAGVISVAIGIVVLVFPIVGLALLLVMTAVALGICGIQVILAGIRGRRQHAVTESLAASHYAPQSQQLGRSGMSKNGWWFSDDKGRYLLFRGVNFGSRAKLAPYLPIAPLAISDLSKFDLTREIASAKKELDLLERLGFNVVRLLISWKALEPYPNPDLAKLLPEGRTYLEAVTEIIDELYARNMFVVLDFHQDIAHEIYGGDGFPDWAIAIDEEHPRPEPSNLRDKKWLIKYSVNKSVKQTLKSFWLNNLTNKEQKLDKYPVRTHLEKTIAQVAKFYRDHDNGRGHPAILGIEPFNEPHPVGLPKREFEEQFLMGYYKNVNSELARTDSLSFLFMEPRVDWTVSRGGGDQGTIGSGPFSAKDTFHMDLVKDVMLEQRLDSKQLQTYLPENLGSISTFGQNGVLSFHYYDAMAVASSFVKIPESMYTYKREWPAIFEQLVGAAIQRGVIPFLTEFGGYQGAEQIREYLNLQYEQIENHLLNATCWNYDLYHTAEGKDNWNLEDYSLLGPDRKPRNIDVVARPYPLRSSAEPVLLFFDIESKYATIVLRGRPVDAPTIIYVPSVFHYQPSFTVWATGESIRWDKEKQLLYWTPSKEVNNQIVISKTKELDIVLLPDNARSMRKDLVLMGTFA